MLVRVEQRLDGRADRGAARAHRVPDAAGERTAPVRASAGLAGRQAATGTRL